MKILSASQIRELDNVTIVNQSITSIELMERASLAFCNWLISKFDSTYSLLIIAGTGNNGGDGLAVARILRKEGYEVSVAIVGNIENGSPDFLTNLYNLPKDLTPLKISWEEDLSSLIKSDIIIDALFGSGLNRPAGGIQAKAIEWMNQNPAPKLAVDVPSGMFCDHLNKKNDTIVESNYTITFQLPKLSFLLPENEKFVGNWSVLDIGLDRSFIHEQATDYEFILPESLYSKVKVRSKFSHKGTYGHALLMAGSYGKIGAAVLAAKASLKTGVGLLTVQVPRCGYNIIQATVPEAMCLADDCDTELSTLQSLSLYDALGVGPGIGKGASTRNLLENVLRNYKKPLVIDADGLNILAEYPELLKLLPKDSILTPHPKEFERLTAKAETSFDRLRLLKEFCKEYNCVTVLKGANSAICTPVGKIYFNSTGNPGMATGGSGDVLTGIITSLVAQGYNVIDATIIGVYLHGYAGDKAAEMLGYESLIASDIIDQIHKFFKELKN